MVNRQHADFTARERVSQNSPRRLVTLGIAESPGNYRSIGEIGVEVAGRESLLREPRVFSPGRKYGCNLKRTMPRVLALFEEVNVRLPEGARWSVNGIDSFH